MERAGVLLGLTLCFLVLCLGCVDARPDSFGRRQALSKGVGAAQAQGIGNQQRRHKQNVTDLFSVIPGRYPKTVSLPEVLANIPDGPAGRAFIAALANELYTRFGVWIPDFIVDQFFEDSSALLDYLQFTAAELYDGIYALNWAYQNGYISNDAPQVVLLPNGFDLSQSQAFPLNLSNYIPGPPVQLAPGLWKGFYPGNATDTKIQSEIVLSMAFNQLANNSHLSSSDPRLFSVTYNGKAYVSLDDFLNALLANGHTIEVYLNWHAVDFFGWLTKDSAGEWREVPVPVMMDTGIYADGLGQAIITAIHDQLVIEIRSGPNSKGLTFDLNLLWYEGDDGIGFFAGDLYSYATWVGEVNTESLSGADAVRYLHLAGVFTDVLLQVAEQNNLYDLGYGATGVCVDSIAVVEYVLFNEMTLYPLLMEKYLVIPIVRRYEALKNRNAEQYAQLLNALDYLPSDTFDNPTLKSRVVNTITWPDGEEPFQTVVDAKKILGMN